MAESVPLQFSVPDMVTQDAVRLIIEALRKIEPGADVVADLETKHLLIGARIDSGRAAEAIEAAGFTVKALG